MFNETQEALEQQSASADILSVISKSMDDAQPVFDRIAESALQLFDGVGVGILLVEDGLIQVKAAVGSVNLDAARNMYPMPVNRGSFTGRAILDKKLMNVADVEAPGIPETAKELGRRLGYRSNATMPMIRAGVAIGTISVHRETPGALSDKEIGLLRTFADQAVIAIENARLFNETREALEQQTAMAEVLEVISNSVEDTQPVFDKILASCERLITCSDLAMLTVEADSLVHVRAVRGPHGLMATQKYKPVPIERTVIAQAVLEGDTVHIQDALEGDDVPAPIRRLAAKTGNYSCLIAPLIWQSKTIGAIYVVRSFKERQWPRFTVKDISLL